MSIALTAGTFDPPTIGHIDFILRASKICSKLYVVVAKHFHKSPSFSLEERVDLLKMALPKNTPIEVHPVSGLVIDFAKKNRVDFFIRGIRTLRDTEDGSNMAHINKTLGGYETAFIINSSEFGHMSSTLVKELVAYGADIKNFVPPPIEQIVLTRLRSLYSISSIAEEGTHEKN